MRIINNSLNECLFFVKDQASPKDNNPRIRNVFSLELKLMVFFMKKQYMKVIVNIKNGIIFEVINRKICLYLLESNKYLIPKKAFNEKIDEICRAQQGVFVEKILRVNIKIKGKNVRR